MITKEGIVTQTSGSKAWITTTRSKSCDSCEARESCTEHSNVKQMTIQVENSLNAITGDRVLIGFETGSLIKVSFMLYIFPIILLIAGAVIGELIANKLNIDKSMPSMIIGAMFFTSSFFIIRVINNALKNKKNYQPFLMRFMQKAGSCKTKH